jgi:hypothetical protein
VAQTLELCGEVQRRAAEPRGIGKSIPEHFADDERARHGPAS